MRIRIGIAAGIAMLFASAGGAQEMQPLRIAQGAAPSAGARASVETAQQPLRRSAVRVPMEAALVKGAPYSAELLIEDVQVLADGNRIVRKTTGRVFRDSQGRVRREEDVEPGRVGSVSVTDPVANLSFSLDPQGKTAWKTSFSAAGAIASRIPPPPPPPPAPGDPAEIELRRRVEAEITAHAAAGGGRELGIVPMKRQGPAPKIEKLGSRTIEGVMAEGTRTTHTIPAGAIGNEQPIQSVVEEWVSPELRILVMTRSSDPRSGEHTYRVLNITRAEPNQSWFEIPADYTVRESGVRRLAPSMRTPR